MSLHTMGMGENSRVWEGGLQGRKRKDLATPPQVSLGALLRDIWGFLQGNLHFHGKMLNFGAGSWLAALLG